MKMVRLAKRTADIR